MARFYGCSYFDLADRPAFYRAYAHTAMQAAQLAAEYREANRRAGL